MTLASDFVPARPAWLGALGAAAVAWAGALGCSSQPSPSPPLSADDGWQTTSSPTGSAHGSAPGRPRPVPPDQRKPWNKLDTLEKLYAAGTRGPSDHLGGAFERTVRINAAARGYLDRGSRRPLPTGALIVQLHHRPGEEAMETAFVMEKGVSGHAPERGDWDYSVLDQQWRVERPLDVELCAECHLAAPRDSLFGPPP